MTQGVIYCIPKGNKPRYLFKNWSIFFANFLYKMGSSVIAACLKCALPYFYFHLTDIFSPG